MEKFVLAKYSEFENKINIITSNITSQELPTEISHLKTIFTDMLSYFHSYLKNIGPKLKFTNTYLNEILNDYFFLENKLNLLEQIYWPVLTKYESEERLFLEILITAFKRIDCLSRENIVEKIAVATFNNTGYSTIPDNPLHIFYFPHYEKFTLLNYPIVYHEIGHNILSNKIIANIILQRFKSKLSDLKNYQQKMIDKADNKSNRFKKLSTILESWNKWTNEIACDIIGTILSGPAFVYAIVKLFISSGYHPYEFKDFSIYPSIDMRIKICLNTLAKSEIFNHDIFYIQSLWNDYTLNRKVTYRNDYYNFFDDNIINDLIESVWEGAYKLQLPFYKKQHSHITPEDLVGENILDNFEQILNICWQKYIEDAKGYFEYEKAIMQLLKKGYSSS